MDAIQSDATSEIAGSAPASAVGFRGEGLAATGGVAGALLYLFYVLLFLLRNLRLWREVTLRIDARLALRQVTHVAARREYLVLAAQDPG